MADNGIVISATVDTRQLNDIQATLDQAVHSAIQASLAIIRDRWQQEAQNKLNSTRPLYLQGLNFDSVIYPDGDDMSGAVQLKGKLPNMIESGYGTFDIKIGFSKSSRKIAKKDGGWYLTIPFRHSTPGSFMYGNPMPKDIYGVAKKLNGYVKGQTGAGRISQPGVGDVSWKGYQRKNKTYDGMVRIVKSYQKATQSQYMTFRRVSDKSDPNSWWHPGYPGIKIASSLESFAEKTFVDILKYNIGNL